MEIITVRLGSRNLRQVKLRQMNYSNAIPTGSIKPPDHAAFGVQPQGCGMDAARMRHGHGTPNRSAKRSVARQLCLKTLSVWRYRGRRPHRCSIGSRNRGYIAS
jgi:hypothetical protein